MKTLTLFLSLAALMLLYYEKGTKTSTSKTLVNPQESTKKASETKNNDKNKILDYDYLGKNTGC
jgi:hypothetical protein